jgi:hypothetical protein
MLRMVSYLIVKLIQQAAQGSMRCASAGKGRNGVQCPWDTELLGTYSAMKCRGIN